MSIAKIGVVGAGWWACEFHIPHLLKNPNADLVAVSRLGAWSYALELCLEIGRAHV